MKTLILLLFCPLILISASGPGHLWLNNGLQLNGIIKFDEQKHRVSILCFDTTLYLTPSQVKQFEFKDSQSSVRRIFLGSVLGRFSDQHQFFELLLSGTITLMRTRSLGPSEWIVNHPRFFYKSDIPVQYDYLVLFEDELFRIKNFKKTLSLLMGHHWQTSWNYGRIEAKHHNRVVAFVLAIDHYNLFMDPAYQDINSGVQLALFE